MVLTTEERLFLAEHVFREGDRYTDLVWQHFDDKFSDKPVPYRNAVRNLVHKFHETESVADAKGGRLVKLSKEKLLDISDSLQQNLGKSLRKSAQQ